MCPHAIKQRLQSTSVLEKWPAAIFRTSASLPPPKSVVFVGCTRGGSAQIESDGLLGVSCWGEGKQTAAFARSHDGLTQLQGIASRACDSSENASGNV
jgi:hypothetical protein